jgi:hypothetical protein
VSGSDPLPVIACELAALSEQERVRRASLAGAMSAAVIEVAELPSGYAFHLDRTAAVARVVVELVGLERKRCPFLRFSSRIEPARDRRQNLHRRAVRHRSPSIPQGGPMKPASLLAAVLLDVVALAHLLRLVFHTEVTVGGTVVPMWISVVGCVVAAILSILVLREARVTTP